MLPPTEQIIEFFSQKLLHLITQTRRSEMFRDALEIDIFMPYTMKGKEIKTANPLKQFRNNAFSCYLKPTKPWRIACLPTLSLNLNTTIYLMF